MKIVIEYLKWNVLKRLTNVKFIMMIIMNVKNVQLDMHLKEIIEENAKIYQRHLMNIFQMITN